MHGLRTPFWFHVPKCGTSFVLTLLHWACPGLDPADDGRIDIAGTHHADGQTEWIRWRAAQLPPGGCTVPITGILAGHQPYNRMAHRGQAVGLFREPIERIASLFHYWGADSMEKFLPMVMEKGFHYQAFIYTGMLLGYDHAMLKSGNITLTKADYVEAKRVVVEDFAFVGLVHEYARSVCLFHAMFGGQPLPVELENIHPTYHEGDKLTKHLVALNKYAEESAVLKAAGWPDGFDQGIYDTVRSVFAARLKLHPHCL